MGRLGVLFFAICTISAFHAEGRELFDHACDAKVLESVGQTVAITIDLQRENVRAEAIENFWGKAMGLKILVNEQVHAAFAQEPKVNGALPTLFPQGNSRSGSGFASLVRRLNTDIADYRAQNEDLIIDLSRLEGFRTAYGSCAIDANSIKNILSEKQLEEEPPAPSEPVPAPLPSPTPEPAGDRSPRSDVDPSTRSPNMPTGGDRSPLKST